MRAVLLFCAALAAAAPAMSQDLVARQGEDMIRLADTPCDNQGVLGKLPAQFQEQYLQASATVQGQTFSACWRKAGSVVHLIYEDGDQGLVPLADLKAELQA